MSVVEKSIKLRSMHIHHISLGQHKASITVEASLSFSLVLFVLFLVLGPIFILQTSKEIILAVDNRSKTISYYQMLKENLSNEDTDYSKLTNDALNDQIYVNDMELKDNETFSNVITESLFNLSNYGLLYATIKNSINETHNSNNAFDNLRLILPYEFDVYDEKTKNIRFDFISWFQLPFNLFNVPDLAQRFISFRRAFVGVDGDRYEDITTIDENDNTVYIAMNHINSHIYHLDRYCTYLQKNTTKISFQELSHYTNADGKSYISCGYCCGNIHLSINSNIYITRYGDKYHYLERCPKMTAIVTEISIDDAKERGLKTCAKCARNSNDD